MILLEVHKVSAEFETEMKQKDKEFNGRDWGYHVRETQVQYPLKP